MDPNCYMVVFVHCEPVNSSEAKTVHLNHDLDHFVEHELFELRGVDIFNRDAIILLLFTLFVPDGCASLNNLHQSIRS